MEDLQTRAGKWTSGVLWAITPLSSLAVLGMWLVWAFSSALTVRRIAVVVGADLLLLCVVVLLIAGRAGRVGLAQAYAATCPVGDMPSPELPATVPSGLALRMRGLLGVICFFVALIGVWGLVGGEVVYASQAADIREAGARVVAAPVVKVSHLRRHAGRTDIEFSSTVTVMLVGESSESGKRLVTLSARSHEEPRPGAELKVMYAPSDLSLGAVHGDSATLDRLMSGRAMAPGLTWGLTFAMAGVAVVLAVVNGWTGGFRSIKHLNGDVRAFRGSRVASGRWSTGQAGSSSGEECLLVHGAAGETLHVRVERKPSAIAEVVGHEPVWACWPAVDDGSDGGGRAPAVLVGDSGWALHGEVWTAEARNLQQSRAHVVGSEGAPVDDRRRVRLWSPVTAWPVLLPPRSLVCVVVALVVAGACLTDVAGTWRWVLGVIGDVALLAAAAMYVGPATRHAKLAGPNAVPQPRPGVGSPTRRAEQ
jgi:hypothetical protein